MAATYTQYQPGRFEIVERHGNVAIRTWESVQQDTPVRVTEFYVCDAKAELWEGLIGKTPIDGTRNWVYGMVRTAAGGHIYVTPFGDDGNLKPDWHVETDEHPIPKPRDGRTYTWEYRNAQWRKKEYPRCGQCMYWHKPELPFCEECCLCHDPKRTCDWAWGHRAQ